MGTWFSIILPNSFCQSTCICMMPDDMDIHFTASPHAIIQFFLSQMLWYFVVSAGKELGTVMKPLKLWSVASAMEYKLLLNNLYLQRLRWSILRERYMLFFFLFFFLNKLKWLCASRTQSFPVAKVQVRFYYYFISFYNIIYTEFIRRKPQGNLLFEIIQMFHDIRFSSLSRDVQNKVFIIS